MDSFTWSNIVALLAILVSAISLWRTRALEQLKAIEQRKTERLKIEFAKIYSDRAEVIRGTYQELCSLEELVKKGVSRTDDELKEWYNEADTACTAFLRTWEANQLYFNESICNLMEQGVKELLVEAMIKIKNAKLYLDKSSQHNEITEGYIEQHERIRAMLSSDFPDIKKKIAEEFRLLLGAIEGEETKGKTSTNPLLIVGLSWRWPFIKKHRI